MRIPLIFVFVYTISHVAIAQNPFEQFGDKKQVLTMTNGRFNEFHDLDSVVQIGSILLDVNKKIIVGYIPEDTIPYMPSPTIISRWWSVDPLAEKFYDQSPYDFSFNNPIRFVDPTGMAPVDNIYFDQNGQEINREVNDEPDRFFVKTGETHKRDNQTATITISNNYEEVDLQNSELGAMARTVYAEMAGGDKNSKQVVAESIKNRTELPEGVYEHADTYSDAINKFYDVSNPKDGANARFVDPQKSATADRPGDRQALVDAVSVSINVHYGNDAKEIGKGVIFYNSASSTIYDKKPGFEKINLDVTTSGIKGTWKVKGH